MLHVAVRLSCSKSVCAFAASWQSDRTRCVRLLDLGVALVFSDDSWPPLCSKEKNIVALALHPINDHVNAKVVLVERKKEKPRR